MVRCSVAGPTPPPRRLWRELAVRAVELVGAAAAASDPGLHAQLALAECAIQAGGHAEAAGPAGAGRGPAGPPFAYAGGSSCGTPSWPAASTRPPPPPGSCAAGSWRAAARAATFAGR
jgi:hypothetical protein